MAYDDYTPSTLDTWTARAREALLMEQLEHQRWRANFYQALRRNLKAKTAAELAPLAPED